ncbi:MAG TPA: M48 family metalloprotease [Blastocatellia bacterium]|nr:M48 family metalloprotease [Blastocatellia bacterium]
MIASVNQWLKRARTAAWLTGLLSAAVAGQSVPGPGFNLFSPPQEIEIGRESAAQIERQAPLLRDATLSSYLNRIGLQLAAQAPGERYPWSFRVINVPDIAAFALPGGPVYLTRGAIEAAHSEGELAGLIAHALAHIALRHGAGQASKAYLAQAGLSVMGGLPGGALAGIIGAVGGCGLNPVFLNYSREAEMQADLLSAQMLAQAGYDPRELASFFETARRSGNAQSGQTSCFSDHPSLLSRRERVIQSAMQLLVPRPLQRGYSFDQMQHYVASLPRSDLRSIPFGGAVAGVSRPPSGAVIDVRIEKPSPRTIIWRQPGSLYNVAYPDNWQAWPSSDRFGVTFVPAGGAVQRNGIEQLVYGAMINHYRPLGDNSRFSGRPQRRLRYVGGRGALPEATNDLLNSLLQNNPQLDYVRGSARRGTIDGGRAITLTLTGRSPITGRAQQVQLYTRTRDEERINDALFIAPDDEFADLRHIFNQMLRSLNIDDRALDEN